jgi:predicted ATP-grasp superfamily ATP-dependent carboligase
VSAFLTDAEWHLTLSAIRSLGKRDIEVVAGSAEGHYFGLGSRYCKHYVRYPHPNKEYFLESLYSLIKEEKSDVLIPMSDLILLPLSKNIKKFEDETTIPIPVFKTIMKAVDKFETFRSACELNIPVPKTDCVDDGGLEDFAQNTDYPLIVKPRMGGRAATGVFRVNSPAELLKAYEGIKATFGSVIIQEYIPGGSVQMRMVNALYNKDSEAIALFTAKKLREYPITGGVTTVGESTWDPQLAELGRKLLDTWKWYGVAEIEFKVDPRDNTPKLIEVNPRFWTYLQLPIYCGVDFPYLLHKISLDEFVSPIETYKTGVKYVHPVKDVLSMLKILHNSMSRKTFFDLMSSYRGEKTYTLFSWKDPLPIFGKMISAFAGSIIKGHDNQFRGIDK